MYPARTFRSFWDHQVRWRGRTAVQPLSYVALLFTARTALGSACRPRRAGKMDRGRLSACVLDPAFCDGLDGGDLGRRGTKSCDGRLAGAAA